MDFRLRGSITDARNGTANPNTSSPTKTPGDDVSLVVATCQLPSKMQRHGHHEVGVLQKIDNGRLVQEAIGQDLRQRPATTVFQLMDQFPERAIKYPQPNDSLEWINPHPLTPGTDRIRLRKGLAAPGAGFGRLQNDQTLLADPT